jgi:hypothetical protein
VFFSGACFLGIVVCIGLGLIHGLNPLLFVAIVVFALAGWGNLLVDGLP